MPEETGEILTWSGSSDSTRSLPFLSHWTVGAGSPDQVQVAVVASPSSGLFLENVRSPVMAGATEQGEARGRGVQISPHTHTSGESLTAVH